MGAGAFSGALLGAVIVVGIGLALIGAFIFLLGWMLSMCIRAICDIVSALQSGAGPMSGPYERAEALMREALSADEYRQLLRRGFVDIASPGHAGRIYRVPRFLGRVTVYENGVATQALCVQSSEAIPSPDVIVMHKLMILGDEAAYLASANHFPALIPAEPYHSRLSPPEPELWGWLRAYMATRRAV